MTKIYHFSTSIGRKANDGLHPSEPKHTEELGTIKYEPGDTIALRAGETHPPIVLTRSGAEGKDIVLSTYRLGTERTAWTNVKADPMATRPIAVDVNASYIDIRKVQASEARYAGFMLRKQQGHIKVRSPRARRCGFGFRLESSYSLIDHPDIQQLVISKTGAGLLNEGATGISVQADGFLCTDNAINRPYIVGAWALTDVGQDGTDVELFGELRNLTITGGVFLLAKAGHEIGGPTKKADGSIALMRNIRIENNLYVNCGEILMFNEPTSLFPIRADGIVFKGNTIRSMGRKRDAIYFKGDWLDVSNVLTLEDNVYSGLGGWVGANGKTNLNSIRHSGNIYQSLEDTTLGYSIGSDEIVADPLFVNPARMDFRPTKASPKSAGRVPGAYASYQALSYADEDILNWMFKKTRIPPTANHFKGGTHTNAYHRDMWATPTERRAAGMGSYISAYNQTWQLQSDLDTWVQTDVDVFV